MLEDRGVGCQSSYRQLVDVAAQGTGAQEAASDVVEPDALAQVVEQLGALHSRCQPPSEGPVPVGDCRRVDSERERVLFACTLLANEGLARRGASRPQR